MTRPLLAALAIGILVGLASLVPTTTGEQQNGDGHSRPEAAGGYVAKPRPALPAVAAARKEAHPAGPTRAPESVADLQGRTPALLSGALELPASFAVVRNGLASTVGDGFPDDYLALPQGPGFRARICGAGGCVTRVSTDKGPDQRVFPDRIADLSAADFWTVSHQDWRVVGLTPVSVVIEGRGTP